MNKKSTSSKYVVSEFLFTFHFAKFTHMVLGCSVSPKKSINQKKTKSTPFWQQQKTKLLTQKVAWQDRFSFLSIWLQRRQKECKKGGPIHTRTLVFYPFFTPFYHFFRPRPIKSTFYHSCDFYHTVKITFLPTKKHKIKIKKKSQAHPTSAANQTKGGYIGGGGWCSWSFLCLLSLFFPYCSWRFPMIKDGGDGIKSWKSDFCDRRRGDLLR